MSEDYDILEISCPKCNQSPIRSRRCMEISCDEGSIDVSDEDFCKEGTVLVLCSECKGTGTIIWCPHCGADLTCQDLPDEEDYYDYESE